MNEELARYYEEWWENPRDPRGPIFKRLNGVVRKYLPPGGGRTALDVGSGKGTIVGFLREKNYRVTAETVGADAMQDGLDTLLG